jgi:hypothetical protein
MAKPIIADSGNESTINTIRLEPGRELFAERYNEIEHIKGEAWYVPASHLLDDRYIVRLGDNPSCECADSGYRHVFCKHQVAASIAASKSRTCDCCGVSVLGRFLSEVTEDDGLLSWYPGDELCGTCISAGYWS